MDSPFISYSTSSCHHSPLPISRSLPASLQIAQAFRPYVVYIGLWDAIRSLARLYEYLFGTILFSPIAVLAWFPFVSEFQTRLLFNQAFSRGLQISRILAGRKK